jgi:hypothetical protein
MSLQANRFKTKKKQSLKYPKMRKRELNHLVDRILIAVKLKKKLQL